MLQFPEWRQTLTSDALSKIFCSESNILDKVPGGLSVVLSFADALEDSLEDSNLNDTFAHASETVAKEGDPEVTISVLVLTGSNESSNGNPLVHEWSKDG